jgi:hypothetical protein
VGVVPNRRGIGTLDKLPVSVRFQAECPDSPIEWSSLVGAIEFLDLGTRGHLLSKFTLAHFYGTNPRLPHVPRLWSGIAWGTS